MTQQIINIGAAPNDGEGDNLRTAFDKVNDNFSNVWAQGPVDSNVRIQGNTISTLQINQDLALSPNGTGNIRLNNNTIPGTNNTWFLGSTTNRWRGLYVGNIDANNLAINSGLTVPGDAYIGGNLTVVGNTIQIGNITTDTKTIQLANTATTDSAANGAGVTVGANDDIATLLYESGNNVWTTNIGLQVGGPVTGTSLAVSSATIYGNIAAINGNFTGNVAANYFIGNGSQLTGMYGNANVSNFLANGFGANSISTTGNITANYFLGNGSQLTGIQTGATISNTAPALGNGGIWWNSVDGRAYVKYGNIFIDLSPSLVPDPTTYVGNVSFDDITVTNVGNIIPAGNNAYSLGSEAFQWKDLWVSNNTIYINSVPLTLNSDNQLEVGGNVVSGGGVSLVPNMVTYGNGSLYGNSNPGFTVVDGLDDDDDSYSIPVDFPLEFLGNSYSSGNVRLVSNSYLTFGPDSYDDYHSVGPGIVPVPAIYMGAMDLSLQKYYYGYADGTDIFVIGYEGSIDTSGEENYPAIQWELQVNSATPDQLLLVMGGPGNEGASLNFPGGVWGLSNGEKWVDQFQPLPWYSNYADTTYNAIAVAPVTPVAASTIAFVGPGVTIGADGGTTYVNIDPFDNAIDVGYDDNNSDAVISSVYYGLKLTTAQDGEDITIAPLGDVQIRGGDRSSNQPGDGFDVLIRGGDAYDNPNTPGQNYDGGDIQIRGGYKVGNGIPGTIRLYTNNSNQWTFDGTGILALPASSGQIGRSGYTNGIDLYNNNGGSGYVRMNYADESVVWADPGGVHVQSTGGTWDFDTTGNLILPLGGIITETSIPGGALTGNTIALKPQGGIDADQQLLIYPTAIPGTDANHLHLTTGNLYNTELYLGDDYLYVKLANTGNVVVNSNDGAGNTAQWTFDTIGNLTTPQGMVISGNVNFLNTDTALINPADNTPLSLFSSGANGTVTSFWTDDIGNLMTSNIAAFYLPLQGTQTVRIVNGNNGGNIAIYDFGNDGVFTTANITATYAYGDTTEANVFVGGTANISGNITAGNVVMSGGIVGSGASPAPYLSGFSSVSAIAVTATGNVTGGNVVTTGTGGNITMTGGNILGANVVTANSFVGNGATLSNVATQVTGSWTVPVGNSTQSFTVTPNETYYLWVDCNIPNGILAWNATATVTNTNVPVVGAQYAWVYTGGGTPIDFTSIPNQFTGTANTIVRSSVAPSSTTNRFDFGINNTSGNSVVVNYGYTKIS